MLPRTALLAYLLSLTTFTSAHNNGTTTTTTTDPNTSEPADVYLNVPELHVGRLELDIEDLSANINLAAEVAGLVSINAGIQLGASKVNLTIQDLDAELQLVVRLDNIVAIVNRTLESLDENPDLVGVLSGLGGAASTVVSSVVGQATGAVGTATSAVSVLSSVFASATAVAGTR